MPRVSSIEIVKRAEQPILCIRTTTKMELLPQLIGESYGEMAAYLAELGEHLSDPPYVAYLNMDMNNLQVELGFPVASKLPGRGEILADTVPAGKSAYCLYRGAYSAMAPVYAEVSEWIASKGLTPTGVVYESYLNSPEFGESELLTQIMFRLQ